MSPPQSTRLRCWFCVLALLVASAATGAATVSVRVEPAIAQVDQSFLLLFEADRNVRVDPDLSPLESQFVIISQSRTHGRSPGRGSARSRTTWQVELMPTRAGTFTIPTIRFGSLQSAPVEVVVRRGRTASAATPADFFVEAELDEHHPYAQQQVIFTARVFQSVKPTVSSLSDPEPGGVDALVLALGPGGYAEEDTIHAGRRYRVYERRYAIFPQASGALVIPPLRLKAKIRQRGRLSSGGSAAPGMRFIEARSEAIRIPVRDALAKPDSDWLPARALSLRDAWTPTDGISVGDTVTRRITIRAVGLTAAQLPELVLDIPDGMKQYGGQPDLNDRFERDGVTGTRVQTITLVATRPGTYTLPAITVDWWNTDSRRTERAMLPVHTIEVLASAADAGTRGAPETGVEPASTPRQGTGAGAAWRWLSGGLAVAWLLTLWRWRNYRRRNASTARPARPMPDRSAGQALADLRRASARHDPAAARDALLAWSAATWPDDPPLNLTQIAARCTEVPATAFDELQRALYASGPTNWDGTALLKHVGRLPPPAPDPVRRPGDELVPLYKFRQYES